MEGKQDKMKGNISLMRRWGSMWIKALVIYLALVVLFVMVMYIGQKRICSRKACGIVTEITQDLDRKKEDTWYRLKVLFTAEDGETYEVGQIVREDSRYELEQEVELHYNPDNPTIFYLSR